VIASLQDAKDKANGRTFRSGVMQFISALELYKADNGSYPGESNDCPEHDFAISKIADGSEVISPETSCDGTDAQIDIRPLLIPKYIAKIPTLYNPNSLLWNLDFHIGSRRCVGDTSPVLYVIAIPSTQKGFEDWPYLSTDTGVTADPNYRCFSLK
jgi:hypothetical protein